MDPRDRLDRARGAARSGDYEFALREYIWFHDHALEERPSLYGVRLSYALADWIELGENYPPALRALENIADRKTADLLAGAGDRGTFHDVVSINEYLARERNT